MTGVCLSALHLLQEKDQLIQHNSHLESMLHAVILREIAQARSSCALRRQLSASKQQIKVGAQQLSVTKLDAAYAASELTVLFSCQCCLCWQRDNHKVNSSQGHKLASQHILKRQLCHRLCAERWFQWYRNTLWVHFAA